MPHETGKRLHSEMRKVHDFVVLFNTLWYRDFPFIRGHEPKNQRALFTAHLSAVVKGCADLMGYLTLFEERNRTDIVIRKLNAKEELPAWAKVELEWVAVRHEIEVNEIRKLSAAYKNNEADNYIFVGHANELHLSEELQALQRQWPYEKQLLVFLIVGKADGLQRRFHTLQTYRVRAGKAKMVRQQHAYPWEVPDTSWQATTGVG
jgi:hypothetical protein